jgi:hypothetical protein
MAQDPSGLAGTVRAMRPFVPAKDFEVSKRFYAEIGFALRPLGNTMAEMHIGPHSFLLQNHYVAQWADNFVMHMLVDDVDRWWIHLAKLDLPKRYGIAAPREPKLESWGLKVAYMTDPSGVLWHIAELPRL